MTTIDPVRTGRAPLLPATAIVGATALLCATVAVGRGVEPAAGLLVAVAAIAAGHRLASRWEVLVAITVLVVLFVPIKRYKLPVTLPFDLELYRVVLAAVLALWIGALLADGVTRLRRTPLDAPIGLSLAAVVASIAMNPGGITNFPILQSFAGDNFSGVIRDAANFKLPDLSTDVLKQIAFLASFVLAFYLIVSVIRTPTQIDTVVKTLVIGGSIVAAFALYERRTGYNVFNHLGQVLPILQFVDVDEGNLRSGRVRALGSAQHPIALAAMLVMLLPLTLYLVERTRQRRWWLAALLLAIVPLATVSRTAIVMAIAATVVYAVLRPSLVRAALPFLLPFLVVVHFVSPGAIGGIREAFFPSKGLVEDQSEFGGRISSVRLGPQLDIISQQPLLGQGYGTRVTAGPDTNARILDDQWLDTAVETGLVGLGAWAWLFIRFVRRCGRAAREDDTPRGGLLTALAASIVAFAVGMLTFDAFSFIQVTVVMYVLLALGCCALLATDRWSTPREPFGPRPLPTPDPWHEEPT